jgi:outer membrane lipoprotein LolB
MMGRSGVTRLTLLLLLALPLQGCFFLDWFTVSSEAEPKPTTTEETIPPRWDLDGRIGVIHGGEGWHGQLSWVQNNGDFTGKISGPFGSNHAELAKVGEQVELRAPSGKSISGERFRQWQVKVFGSAIPIKALPYWMHGLPYPAIKNTVVKKNQQGAVQELRQDGWAIGYSRWKTFGDDVLPGKMSLVKGDVRMKLIVNEYHIRK